MLLSSSLLCHYKHYHWIHHHNNTNNNTRWCKYYTVRACHRVAFAESVDYNSAILESYKTKFRKWSKVSEWKEEVGRESTIISRDMQCPLRTIVHHITLTVSTYSTTSVYSVWWKLSTFNMYCALSLMRTYVPSCWEGRLGRRVALRRSIAHIFHHWALRAADGQIQINEVMQRNDNVVTWWWIVGNSMRE